MPNANFDGGGFPLFRSYHDVRLPLKLVGPKVSDTVQCRYAFQDFIKAIQNDLNWRRWFTALQINAIEKAILNNNPRIEGFCWHHHQDHGVMQLVMASDHSSVHHYGGRFTTGGRPQ